MGGIPLGWVLFIVFFTGTITYFRAEVSVWMQPELHTARPGEEALERLIDLLQQEAPDAPQWNIFLPGPRSPILSVWWKTGQTVEQAAGWHETSSLILDPATGKSIQSRKTDGALLLHRMHFSLYILDGKGFTLVNIAAMTLLAALISGIKY
jgi:uncharacterized iron-regulated membrane protein